jgi:murein peptide amidase A
MTGIRTVSARRRMTAVAAAALLLAAGVISAADMRPASAGRSSAQPQDAEQSVVAAKPAVIGKRVIGHSVKDRPIRAWRLGDRNAPTTAVIFGRHHGDEPAGEVVLETLRDGNPVHGIDLWVVPRLNPDGAVRDTRQNAHGVDLNRNFPWHWKPRTGYYYSGPHAASEPETRTAMRFLNNVDPDYVVSIHQPFYGLDVTHAKDRAFARRLSRELRLPNEFLPCNRRCGGSMSGWFNRNHRGASVTIEFGEHPSQRYLTVRAPRGLVRALGGTRGGGGA